MPEIEEFEENLAQLNTVEQTDKKCPSCGAKLSYSPGQKMVCDYCGYEEAVKDTAPAAGSRTPDAQNGAVGGGRGRLQPNRKGVHKGQVVIEIPLQLAEENANYDWGTEKVNIKCQSCGAYITCDPTQISETCPYCEANLVTAEQNDKAMAPQGICPFNIDEKKARKAHEQWLDDLWFAPNDVKKKAVGGKLTGIYAPYWSFDAECFCTYKGEYSRGSGKHKSWYRCQGSFNHFFDDYLLQASNKEHADLIHEVEPFETTHCKPYNPQYVAGFSSERYSIGVKEGWEMAQTNIFNQDINDIIRQDIKKYHPGSDTRVSSKQLTFNDVSFKYLLLPLWLSTYRYNGKVYHFIVNGQTGKVAGDRPYSFWKIFFLVLFILAVCYFVVMLDQG